MDEELKDKLIETIAICELHNQRMFFAWENISHHFPLSEESFGKISQMEMALFDQLIYRFSKLQDSMGGRLFKQILEALQEETDGLPFIDILSKLEKLNLLDDAKSWIALRQIRNSISHEYPFFKEIQIQKLNLLPIAVQRLSNIWQNLKVFSIGKFNIEPQK